MLSEFEQDLLFERKRDTRLGRMYRQTKGKGEIAKHYREELERMQEQRARGEVGRLEFEAYF